jgi:hypothetical protein
LLGTIINQNIIKTKENTKNVSRIF